MVWWSELDELAGGGNKLVVGVGVLFSFSLVVNQEELWQAEVSGGYGVG